MYTYVYIYNEKTYFYFYIYIYIYACICASPNPEPPAPRTSCASPALSYRSSRIRSETNNNSLDLLQISRTSFASCSRPLKPCSTPKVGGFGVRVAA